MEQRRLAQRLKESEMPAIVEWLQQEALEKGMLKGLQQGLEEGLAKGLAKGLSEGIEQGIERGREEGMRSRSLDTARRMRERGIGWDVVTEITGVTPADLEAVPAP